VRHVQSCSVKKTTQKGEIVDTAAIIAELEARRDHINSAIEALQSKGGSGKRAAAKATNGRKRHLSAAARKRISDAMKKKWAQRKRAS
jgi:hypothetical protein